MKDAGKEVLHERRKHNLAGLAAESALVSAQVPSLHQYRFQTGRVASLRWPARAVLSASGALQILLAPVLLDRAACTGMNHGQFGSGLVSNELMERFDGD
jgi:hypothetical protein